VPSQEALREFKLVRLIIKTNPRYAKYLKKHLAREHPKTKGKIKIRKS
jgi:hypothetical protein